MSRKHFAIGSVVLITAVFAVYGKSLFYEFLNWDDEILVVLNPHIKGFSAEHIKGMLFNDFGLFIPLIYISFAIDYWMYGLEPWGYRLGNFILHALNCILVLHLFTKVIAPSKHSSSALLLIGTLIACIWGLHPLRVESVVWIAERKDVLSGFFFLLSVIFYLRHADTASAKTSRHHRALSVIFYFLALLAKPSVLPLPVVLVLLDFYPLGKLRFEQGFLIKALRSIQAKWDYCALSILAAIGTFYTTISSKALLTLNYYPIEYRLTNAIYSLGAYIYSIVWPIDLRLYYPLQAIKASNPLIYCSLILFLIVGYYVYKHIRQNNSYALLVVLGSFLAMIFPFLGIFQGGLHGLASRYTYLPSIGFLFLLGAYLLNTKHKKWALSIAGIWLVALTAKTIQQQNYWQNTETYFTELLKKTPSAPTLFYNKLGDNYQRKNEPQKAIAVYTTALTKEGDPSHYSHSAFNVANIYYNLKDFSNAETFLKKTLEFEPRGYLAYNTLGHIYLQRNDHNTAIQYYEKCLQIHPYAQAYNNIGFIHYLNKRYTEAEVALNEAIAIDPNYQNAHTLLGKIKEEKKAQ